MQGEAKAKPKLLIIEPEPLLRWCLSTYLGDWFAVFSTETARGAATVLERQGVDVVVVSDQVPAESVRALEAAARARNERVMIVHIVTSLAEEGANAGAALVLEKPFKFSRLTQMLGVGAGANAPLGKESRCSLRTT